MSHVPQIIITLDPETNAIVAELPGFMATRRKVEVMDLGTLRRMLDAQRENKAEIGQDGAPTQAQVRHWEDHGTWPSERCRFCQSEGRAKPSTERVRQAYTIKRDPDGVEVRRLRVGQSFRHKTLQSKRSPEDLDL